VKQFIEKDWPLGWIPSYSEKGDPTGSSPLGLLRMDNLTRDTRGRLESAKPAKDASTTTFGATVKDIFSSKLDILGGGAALDTTYVYLGNGTLLRNYGTAGDAVTYDKTIFSGGPAGPNARCAFLPALGHVFAISGAKKYKDKGTTQQPIGLPKPTAPVASVNASGTLEIGNLDGSGFMTNWASVATGTFDDTTATLNFTPPATNRAVVQTIFSSPKDMNHIVQAKDNTEEDIFKFNFYIDDPSLLSFVHIAFTCEEPTGSTTTPDIQNYYWQEWDQGRKEWPYKELPVSDGVWLPVEVLRKEFFRVGNDEAKNWSTIKAIRITVGTTGSTTVRFNGFTIQGGKTGNLKDDFEYVAVEVNNTGEYYEFSPASDPVAITIMNASATVTRASACNAQANEFWLFRGSLSTGEFYLVQRQTGAYGFTPATFLDSRLDAEIVEEAITNPYGTLEYFRQNLPDNIIGMIWFSDRIIYLTTKAFFPSFKLDPGSYDSRFFYEISGNEAERCLFITKLDVGTFIVATTKDFYRVSGNFSKITDGEATILDVTVKAMGVSDPAISPAFLEMEGSLMYFSSTGIRTLTNGNSTLINGAIDCLFRLKGTYPINPEYHILWDRACCATSGKRVYWSIQTVGGYPIVLVLDMDAAGSSWRLWTMTVPGDNPTAMTRTEGGKIMFGALSGRPLRYLEDYTAIGNPLPIYFVTQYNYGGSATTRKDALALEIKAFIADDGDRKLTLIVRGLLANGDYQQWTTELLPNNAEDVIRIDLKEHLPPCVAYQIWMYGAVTTRIDYLALTFEERPSMLRRVIQYGTNYGYPGRKRFGLLPFLADPLGHNITVNVKADDVLLAPQVVTGDRIKTLGWLAPAPGILATDLEIEIISDGDLEFYKFLNPEILEKFPVAVKTMIHPATDFGNPRKKKISTWPFRVNPLGGMLTAQVKVDGIPKPAQYFNNLPFPNEIQTFKWLNTEDISGTDWELLVTSDTPFEPYGFSKPEILQIFPMAKKVDQLGPLDFNAKGLVYGMRFRLLPEGTRIDYVVYDGDSIVYGNYFEVAAGRDEVYYERFPKGIDPSVCRVNMWSTYPFYRFSGEFEVRATGKENEAKFVKLTDAYAGS
jgi:hypothetical protein